MTERFKDRVDAGNKLALKLLRFIGERCVVFGLARGGVVVAFEVAKHLDAPLDVIVVRRIGHPDSPEYACGAVTASGDIAVRTLAGELSPAWLDDRSKQEVGEAMRREATYMTNRSPVNVEGQIAILVDDGLATGLTMEAAILAIRRRHPSRVVVAAPIALGDAASRMMVLADEVVVLEQSTEFHAIAQAYDNFSQTTDDLVLTYLSATPRPAHTFPPAR